jgi:hypothetical protein
VCCECRAIDSASFNAFDIVLASDERYTYSGRQVCLRCYLELLLGGGSYDRHRHGQVCVCFRNPTEPSFPELVLPINSQLTTVRASQVPSQLTGQFTAHRQRHSSVLAVSCLCHRHQVNETTDKCLSAKQKGTKGSVQSVLLLRVFR